MIQNKILVHNLHIILQFLYLLVLSVAQFLPLMNFDDINATNFVDARSYEIQKIEDEIQKTSKKSLMFQRVPFHKRRRARNKETKKPKCKTNKEKFLYYHKRFEMKRMYDTLLPYKRRQKSESFIAKSENRGYIWVERHKKVFLYKSIDSSKNIISETITKIWHCNDEYEIFYNKDYLIIIGMSKIDIKDFEYVEDLGISISILKGTKTIRGISWDSFLAKETHLVMEQADLQFDNAVVLPVNNFQNYKIILRSKDLPVIHHKLVNEGYIPICINELFRLGIENKEMIYPFDYPQSKHYKEFENVCYSPEKEKWEKTPKAKRINYAKLGVNDPWFLPDSFASINDETSTILDLKNAIDSLKTSDAFTIAFFECKKGNIARMGMIYNEDEIVGYVLRGSYCYKTGNCRGVCVVNRNTTQDTLKLRNKQSTSYYDVKLI